MILGNINKKMKRQKTSDNDDHDSVRKKFSIFYFLFYIFKKII